MHCAKSTARSSPPPSTWARTTRFKLAEPRLLNPEFGPRCSKCASNGASTLAAESTLFHLERRADLSVCPASASGRLSYRPPEEFDAKERDKKPRHQSDAQRSAFINGIKRWQVDYGSGAAISGHRDCPPHSDNSTLSGGARPIVARAAQASLPQTIHQPGDQPAKPTSDCSPTNQYSRPRPWRTHSTPSPRRRAGFDDLTFEDLLGRGSRQLGVDPPRISTTPLAKDRAERPKTLPTAWAST
jgi:hypothetical protein